jgi:hypothetical protein
MARERMFEDEEASGDVVASDAGKWRSVSAGDAGGRVGIVRVALPA